MSGMLSIASQAALQYLPVVIMQLQTGCAHFCEIVASIVLS
jgi:hypothetical protein